MDCLAQKRMARCIGAAVVAGRMDDMSPQDKDRSWVFQSRFSGFVLRPPPAEVLPLVDAAAQAVLQLLQRAEADGCVSVRVPRCTGAQGSLPLGDVHGRCAARAWFAPQPVQGCGVLSMSTFPAIASEGPDTAVFHTHALPCRPAPDISRLAECITELGWRALTNGSSGHADALVRQKCGFSSQTANVRCFSAM